MKETGHFYCILDTVKVIQSLTNIKVIYSAKVDQSWQ